MKTLLVKAGFKVCYKEKNTNCYILHWLATTHKDAINMINYYKRYPQNSREDNHKLKKPKWKIIPATIKEIHDGIWREVPF